MLFISMAYKYLNQADPDCGTTFTWVVAGVRPAGGLDGRLGDHHLRRARDGEPRADRRALHLPPLVRQPEPELVRGARDRRRLDRRHDLDLLGRDRALSAAAADPADDRGDHADRVRDRRADRRLQRSRRPWMRSSRAFAWFNPFDISSVSTLGTGVLVGIFIYWGWDSGVSVNEESENAAHGPGKAAVLSTVLLVLIYLIVTTASQAYAGPKALGTNANDIFAFLGPKVFPKPISLLLIITVLTSASASTQTTILPTARTSLSMARWGGIPKIFGRVHPKHKTPDVSTIVFGAVSTDLVRRDRHPLAQQRARRLGRRRRLHGLPLLRAHRLRLHLVLPARAVQERRGTSSSSASRRCSAAFRCWACSSSG